MVSGGVFGSAVSLGMVILYAVEHSTSLDAVLTLSLWIMVASQCTMLLVETCPCHPRSSRISILIAISSGCLGLVLLVQILQPYHAKQSLRPFSYDYILFGRAVQCLIALAICFNSLSLPRRPAVYSKGELVDEQNYVSILDNLAFSWAKRIFDKTASAVQINFGDLPYLTKGTRAKQLQRNFASFVRKGKGRPLWRIIYQSLRGRFWLEWLLAVVHGLALYGPPYCLFKTLELLDEYKTAGTGANSLWFWASGIGISRLFESWVLTRLTWYASSAVEIPVRSQLSSVIFQKVLEAKDIKGTEESDGGTNTTSPPRPSVNGKKNGNNKEADLESISSEEDVTESVPLQDLSDGDTSSDGGDNRKEKPEDLTREGVMNLVAVDTARVAEFASKQYVFVHIFVTFTVATVILVRMIGFLSFGAGLLVPAVLMPLNMMASGHYAAAQGNLMSKRDEKIRVVTECLQAVRPIKFSATETQWHRKVMGLRNEELLHQRNVYKWTVVLRFFWVSSPILLSVVALGVYVWTHGSLSAAVAFTSIEVFGNLEFALSLLPYGIMQGLDARVSCDRIQEYLGREDKVQSTIDDGGDEIEFRSATIAWPASNRNESAKDPQFKLLRVSCKFPKGKLSVIVGPSGSGKSLLLASIIDEADVLSGTISVPRSRPRHGGDWITRGALACVTQIPWLENCSLRDNILSGLPFDQQRYNMALDGASLFPDLDQLGDGDRTEVGSRGVNFSGGQCWRMAFARALYSRADTLVLDDIFSAVDSGTALHILQRGLDGPLAQGRTRILVTHHLALCLPRAAYALRLSRDGRAEQMKQDELAKYTSTVDSTEPDALQQQTSQVTTHGNDQKIQQPKTFVEDEFREVGSVKARVYRKYLVASGGYLWWLVSAIFIVGSQVALLARAYWVKVWTESEPAQSGGNTRYNAYYMAIYLGISLCAAIGEAVKCAVVYHSGVVASQNLADVLTGAILGAPLRWLDTVPIGRILNRFSADSATLDSKLPGDAHMLLSSIVLAVITAMMSLGVALYLGIPVIFLLGTTALYASRFLHGAREVKRLESASRSPVMDLLESTLLGLGSIRTYGRVNEYTDRMLHHIDNQSRSTWSLSLVTQWMNFRLGAIGAVFSLMVAIFVVFENVSASLAGLVLSFTFRYTAATEEVVNRYANVELDMNATERILEFSEISQETRDGFDAPPGWPQNGEISIRDLRVSYGPTQDDVLKGLSCHISPMQRVGIVGRTGAGKSSFALAMLRFLYQRSGSITVDGLDIGRMRLRDLRSRITLIPQDPTLFLGTLRSNLDPLGQYDDDAVKLALRRVHLISSPGSNQTTMFDSLDLKISAGGLNLSQGQRQLVCLARALLTRSKVMVIDEATSSVDVATDALIQKSIRQEFHDSTLLVIAHRLRTVADFDKLIVIKDGKLCETGTPLELLNKKGHFWSMVQDSGESDALRAVLQRQGGFLESRSILSVKDT
ncbi:P-loop containing nucleoside triphosphate hydrolase protein [Rhypophila decipiens]|uniref:P-loop containing nucleoside triphosphate hydrolase protein n=1 Tax=Rhypophila decipiens TaxID=261697 RepID=A0AAN6YJP7_9PEZI|nr:P-loop containing nucleoside triphosphate hydrolase protein [Rhypophila decipiens]